MDTFYFNNDTFKSTDIYKMFISENPGIGMIKIRATAARGAIPISGVNVVISKIINDAKVIFYEGVTDESGMIECISLPTPSIDLSDDLVIPASTIYTLNITDAQDNLNEEYEVRVYDGICTMQNINVVPYKEGDM